MEPKIAIAPYQPRWPLAVCCVIVLAVIAAHPYLWPRAADWAGTALTLL